MRFAGGCAGDWPCCDCDCAILPPLAEKPPAGAAVLNAMPLLEGGFWLKAPAWPPAGAKAALSAKAARAAFSGVAAEVALAVLAGRAMPSLTAARAALSVMAARTAGAKPGSALDMATDRPDLSCAKVSDTVPKSAWVTAAVVCCGVLCAAARASTRRLTKAAKSCGAGVSAVCAIVAVAGSALIAAVAA